MKSGLFITFEGTEGSGKTTQSKILYEHLKSQNIKTIWTREIGGVEIAEKIRDIILHNEMDIMTEFLLVLAARKEHITKLIKPSLEDGYVVICDRFIDSTLVYNEYSKFSIQPTIVTKEVFLTTLNNVGELNIWEFEQAIPSTGRDFMVKIGGEKKRGLYHYDSLVFPYIATAINKGKWNLNEYMSELNPMFEEYNINPFERGMS